jgi:hypothetical protein
VTSIYLVQFFQALDETIEPGKLFHKGVLPVTFNDLIELPEYFTRHTAARFFGTSRDDFQSALDRGMPFTLRRGTRIEVERDVFLKWLNIEKFFDLPSAVPGDTFHRQLARFSQETIRRERGAWTPCRDVWEAYLMWCRGNRQLIGMHRLEFVEKLFSLHDVQALPCARQIPIVMDACIPEFRYTGDPEGLRCIPSLAKECNVPRQVIHLAITQRLIEPDLTIQRVQFFYEENAAGVAQLLQEKYPTRIQSQSLSPERDRATHAVAMRRAGLSNDVICQRLGFRSKAQIDRAVTSVTQS